jgi:hypothetical protein
MTIPLAMSSILSFAVNRVQLPRFRSLLRGLYGRQKAELGSVHHAREDKQAALWACTQRTLLRLNFDEQKR